MNWVWMWIMSMYVDAVLENAAWYYPETKEKAQHLKDYVAFCKLPPIPYDIHIGIPCLMAMVAQQHLDKTKVDVSTT